MRFRFRPGRGSVLTAGLCAAVLAGGAAVSASPATAAISGSLWVDPQISAARWVAANPNDQRAQVIKNKIASQPQPRWYTSYNPSQIQSQVASHISSAGSSIPQVVVYGLPNRDCGGASAGGAPDLNSYNTWVRNLAAGLGNKTVIVILEPDSLALQTCLDSNAASARGNALSQAVSTIKSANPNAKVYLDAGHSAWNSASEAANRLRGAGVTKADGFYSNVSNYHTTAEELAFGKAVLSALGNPGNLHQVIDTSRNGKGAKGSEWCDPTGRGIGQAPTLNTGQSTVDAYLWVKLPGESDGCAGAAGSFNPDLAYALATN